MTTIGVVLAGCGNMDGSEIHESTLTLLHLDEQGVSVRVFAPETMLFQSMDYTTRLPMNETRRVYLESARIARGKLAPLHTAKAESLDGLILPGGQGAAKNLCDWAVRGPEGQVDPDLRKLLLDMHRDKKPLGFICIAPVIAALVFGKLGVRLTIGDDVSTAELVERTGAVHVTTAVDEIVTDDAHKIVTTPAYMVGPSIRHIDKGIGKLVEKVVRWAE